MVANVSNRHGLTFAEPGDPDGFLVKWKGRERDRTRLGESDLVPA